VLFRSHVAADFYNKFKPKEWDGYAMLIPGCNGSNVVFTNKAVNTMADWKGMKIRAPGNTGKQMALLGASPVNIPMSDAFDSLTKGVIDGNASAMEAAKTWRLGEACKDLIQTAPCISPNPYNLIMNKDSYNKLPDNVKKIFADVSTDYVELFGLAWNDADMAAWDYLKQMKTTVIEPSDAEMSKWIAAMDPLKQDYVKTMVGKGYTEAEVNGWFSFMNERTAYWLDQQVKLGVKSPIGPTSIRSK
jgi:TRAP-type transport system periplasmic protein